MALDFPASPTNGQNYTSGGITWVYDSTTTAWNISSGYAFQRVVMNPQTDSYTVVLTDEQKLIQMNSSSANTVTVPLNSSVAFPIGAQLNIVQIGTGKTVLAGATGVTINATPGLYLRAQWSVATLIKTDTNVWLAIGDLNAS
jgi:hypothetical protein